MFDDLSIKAILKSDQEYVFFFGFVKSFETSRLFRCINSFHASRFFVEWTKMVIWKLVTTNGEIFCFTVRSLISTI